ncbi:MAG: response regulator [Anaerolinea sp.]|nr:response regulator [Anaerolinea sp.]MCC6975799.1 response regulator [Anaerolineae bacterium]
MSPICQILIVDDDVDLLDLFGIALKRLQCQIIKAAGGKQALETLKNTTPNLILLDVAMPAVTGLDVLREVRSNPRFAQTKVVLLTAVPIMVDPTSASLVSRILIKPITPSALEANVREVMGE